MKKILMTYDKPLSSLNQNTLRRTHLYNFFRNKFNSRYLWIIVKLTDSKNIFSLSKARIVDLEDPNSINEFKNFVVSNYNKMDEWYKSMPVNKLIVNYMESTKLDYDKQNRSMNLSKISSDLSIAPYEGIPYDNYYESYSSDLKNVEDVKINKTDHTTKVTITKDDKKIINFMDTYLNKHDINSGFLRTFADGTKIKFINNLPFFMKKELDCKKYITSNKKEQDLFTNFITLDIETYLLDNVHIPYLVCMYDGVNNYIYHIKDYDSLDALFEQLFKDLVRPEYNDYNVYIHNSSRFDIIFMLKYIVKYCEADLIYKNNKFISVKLIKKISKDEQIVINMFDSYLILLSSLSSLGKTFNVEVQKSTFPHKFVNKDTLEYIGPIPSLTNFYFKTKSEMEDINNYIESHKDIWVCRDESIKYCINDCISLYQIISKFSELIFEKFRINIKNNPTLPSIAMKNYIANYMPTEAVTITKVNKKGEEKTETKHISNIPQLPKEIYDKIKLSYYGGHSDAYIPQFTNNITVPVFNSDEDYLEFKDNIQANFKKGLYKTIKLYDVNSLYPSVMRDYKMPTKLLYEFTGNILLEDLNLLNKVKDQSKIVICNAKISAPNISRPVLPFRDKNTSVFGYGEWTGMYTLLELLEAEKTETKKIN